MIQDLNGDGAADIAVAAIYGNTVHVFSGNGNGTFQTPVGYRANGDSIDITAGDFTGDGRVDLVTADFYQASVSVLPGLPDGTFGPYFAADAGQWIYGVTMADFDSDGDLDIALAAAADNRVTVLGQGNGTFDGTTFLGTSAWPVEVCAADLDGDARPDLVTVNRNSTSMSVMLNRT